MGIQKNHKFTNTIDELGNIMYEPTKGIKICDNIDTDFLDAMNKIYIIFLINKFYYDFNHNIIDSDVYITFNSINKYCDYTEPILKLKGKPYNFNIQDILNNSFNDKSIIGEMESNKTKRFTLNGHKKSLSLWINNNMVIIDNYYDLICKFISKLGNIVDNLDSIIGNLDSIIGNSEYYNQLLTIDIDPNINTIRKDFKLSTNFINKIKFHIHEYNIYIYPQQSGSCSWFSIYWTFLFYFIINDNIEDYKNIIEHIILQFYNRLYNEIFTINEFNNIINKKERDYMFKLYSKFVDLGLFDNSILLNRIDNYYNNPIISYYFIPYLLKLNQMNKLYNLRNIILLNIDNIIVYVSKYLKNKPRYLQIFRGLISTSDRILQREFYLYDIDKEIETVINTKYNLMVFDGPLEPILYTDNKTSYSNTNNIKFKEDIDNKWYQKYLKYKKKYLSISNGGI